MARRIVSGNSFASAILSAAVVVVGLVGPTAFAPCAARAAGTAPASTSTPFPGGAPREALYTPAGLASTKVCIAHRGASAYFPEHTPLAYQKAIGMGADYIEQDLVLTKDGVLICLHDDTLERTTNVATVFPDRYDRPSNPLGEKRKVWRVVDFTVAEIKTLEAGLRHDTPVEGQRVQTFQEAIDLVKGKAGIYPELKSPGFYTRQGFDMIRIFLDQLKKNGLDTIAGQKAAGTPVIVQSFDPAALKRVREMGNKELILIQLVSKPQGKMMLSDSGLIEVAKYAQGLGPARELLEADKTRVRKAHEAGLVLHPYTVDWNDLPPRFQDAEPYISFLLYDLGVDGVFTNNPDLFARNPPKN